MLAGQSRKSLMSRAGDFEEYLSKKDPALGRVINLVRTARGSPLRPPVSRDSPFEALVRAIIYQRVSASAGKTVYLRLEQVAGGKLTPRKILVLAIARIRMAGVATSKATYISNVAKWFSENPTLAKRLRSMSEDEIVESLTSIRGVGLWTVNVLLVFNLGRLDVAPAPDLIIRRICQLVYGLRSVPSAEFVRKKTEAWRPYRSIAAMYLWQAAKLKLTPADIRGGLAKSDEASFQGEM
jgi:DNA-3-methyladenine glycosylase II